jgi:hypothetical protein
MTSFIRAQRGGHTRYDQDNRRLQRGALTYTTEPFAAPTLVAGPIALTLHATATTTEALWVAPGIYPTAPCYGRTTSAPDRRSSPWFPAK